MLNKKVVFIDMDGVLVDFGKEIELQQSILKPNDELLRQPDLIKGIFKNPPVFPGALKGIKTLYESNLFELIIATTAPWENHESASDKRVWIEKNFKGIFEKKMVITHRKDLLLGDYLIDDRLANGAKEFKGELIRFGWDYENKRWNKYPNWESVVKKLLG